MGFFLYLLGGVLLVQILLFCHPIHKKTLELAGKTDGQAGCNTPKPGGRLLPQSWEVPPHHAETTAGKQTYCQEVSFLYTAVHIWCLLRSKTGWKTTALKLSLLSLDCMRLSETKKLPPLIGKLGRESQQSMSSPVPTGEEPFLLLLCSRHWGREPRRIPSDTAQVPAQKVPWKCHQAA